MNDDEELTRIQNKLDRQFAWMWQERPDDRPLEQPSPKFVQMEAAYLSLLGKYEQMCDGKERES